MNYEFAPLAHIDDVLPHIKDSPEFIVVEKDGYTVINYVVATQETFPDDNAMRRECRGLIFGERGQIINRRYHKFFNVNERDETQLDRIDWSKPHVVLEKLDGSMVSACYVKGHIRWMTKMGITDTSMEAEAFVATHPEYTEYVKDLLDEGITPIFEWCSNKNRIVLDYPEDRLVLTGLRSFWMGHYFTYQEMVDDAKPYGIPVVEAYSWNSKPNELIDWIRQNEDTEGVVVRFDDGHMVKIKTDWYVRIHKVKSLLGQERDVVSLILNNELDDLLPVLPREDVEKIEKFQVVLMEQIRLAAWHVYQTVKQNRETMDRKTFAIKYAPTFDPMLRGLVFQFWDKECDEHLTYEAVVAMILKNCGNNGSYAKVKEAFLKDVDYV